MNDIGRDEWKGQTRDPIRAKAGTVSVAKRVCYRELTEVKALVWQVVEDIVLSLPPMRSNVTSMGHAQNVGVAGADGKVVEHRDVLQVVSRESANLNTLLSDRPAS